MTTYITVNKAHVVTEEDGIVLTAGAYKVEVAYTNGKLEFIHFAELDSTYNFARKFSDPKELVKIRDLLSATLIEMKLEEGEYDTL